MEKNWNGLLCICIADNAMEAEMRAALLREEEIDCVVRDHHSYMGAAGILSGGWFTPLDIYVHEEDYDRARELLAACFPDADF